MDFALSTYFDLCTDNEPLLLYVRQALKNFKCICHIVVCTSFCQSGNIDKRYVGMLKLNMEKT